MCSGSILPPSDKCWSFFISFVFVNWHKIRKWQNILSTPYIQRVLNQIIIYHSSMITTLNYILHFNDFSPIPSLQYGKKLRHQSVAQHHVYRTYNKVSLLLRQLPFSIPCHLSDFSIEITKRTKTLSLFSSWLSEPIPSVSMKSSDTFFL